MKSGLEGRNKPEVVAAHNGKYDVSMKSGLEGRNKYDIGGLASQQGQSQ